MKKFFLAAVFLLCALTLHVPALAQSREDVVYFKNGAVLHGLIMEEDPAQWLKIKTADGTLHTYSMDDVSKILKSEAMPDAPPPPSADGYPAWENEPAGINPGTAFLLSFLVPGLGCYVNGGGDTGVGLLCDGLYLGGITLAATAGFSTTEVNLGDGYYAPSTTVTPFFWAGISVAAGGWVLGMIDATSYAAAHQPRHNAYGDLWEFEGRGYSLGFNLSPGPGPSGPSARPLPQLAFRF